MKKIYTRPSALFFEVEHEEELLTGSQLGTSITDYNTDPSDTTTGDITVNPDPIPTPTDDISGSDDAKMAAWTFSVGEDW